MTRHQRKSHPGSDNPHISTVVFTSNLCVPTERGVTVECLTCGHVGFLSPKVLSRAGLTPGTPIAAFVKRLRCRRCGSQSVLATRKPLLNAQPSKVIDGECSD